MKRLNFLGFLLSIIIKSNFIFSQTTDGSNLFNDSYLHEIRFENADTNILLSTSNYQRVKMKVDGFTVDSVGIKEKGNISAYSNPNKIGVKIKTNKYVQNKEYDGIKEFSLNINFHDPTMMREKLTYDICKSIGLYSLRTAFAKVYINNIYWGLYTIVEGKDEMFKQVFKKRGLDAIESLDFGDMCYISNNPADYDVSTNGNNPTYILANGNPLSAWPRFAKMIDKANNTPNSYYTDTVSGYLNLEHFFKYIAANVYLMNMDSYIDFKGNQVYFFDTIAKKWQVMPWDFNASFGLWNTGNTNPTTYPIIPIKISGGCIAGKITNIPLLKNYYLNAMCNLNNTVGDTVNYFPKIDYYKNQIKQAVYDDTRKHFANTDFDNGVSYGYHFLFGDNQPALKTFIKDRLTLISQGLISENHTCQFSGIFEMAKPSYIKIFPNPATDKLYLDSETTDLSEIEIINYLGQTVLRQKYSESVDVSKLSQGYYFIRIDNSYSKFIKE